MATKVKAKFDLEQETGLLPNGKEFQVSEYFSEEDFVLDGGKPFIKHGPMLRAAKELLGIANYSSKVEQAPAGESVTAAVTVTFTFGTGKDQFVWSATADYGPYNASPVGNVHYPVAMAETRAAARALRFALGLEFCSYEELGKSVGGSKAFEGGGSSGGGFSSPITENQKKAIKGRIIKDKEVDMKKIAKILNRDSFSAEDVDGLTKQEASDILTASQGGKLK